MSRRARPIQVGSKESALGRSICYRDSALAARDFHRTTLSRGSLLSAVAMGKSKRKVEAAAAAHGSPKKTARSEVPSVAELGALSAGGAGSGPAVFDQNINIGIMKYCTRGAVYSDAFGDGDLYVVQLASSASPSPLFNLKKQVELFGALQATPEEGAAFPHNWEDFATMFEAGFQFVGKKTEDTDGVGWAKHRSGFYMTGDLKEFLMYFDELMAWRAEYEDAQLEKLASKPKLVIHADMYDTLKLDPVEDEVKCEIEFHEGHPARMSVFDLPPPIFPPRIVILTF